LIAEMLPALPSAHRYSEQLDAVEDYGGRVLLLDQKYRLCIHRRFVAQVGPYPVLCRTAGQKALLMSEGRWRLLKRGMAGIPSFEVLIRQGADRVEWVDVGAGNQCCRVTIPELIRTWLGIRRGDECALVSVAHDAMLICHIDRYQERLTEANAQMLAMFGVEA
jgi:hypothetical protein